MPDDARPCVAYWYPEPYWLDPDADLIKNLLPFFDQVAILLPDYMYGRQRAANPWLAGPLEDMGLLRVLEPGSFVDQEITTRLHELLTGLLTAGVFDDLKIPTSPYDYHELSRSRLGWNADVELSAELVEALLERKLALPSRTGCRSRCIQSSARRSWWFCPSSHPQPAVRADLSCYQSHHRDIGSATL